MSSFLSSSGTPGGGAGDMTGAASVPVGASSTAEATPMPSGGPPPGQVGVSLDNPPQSSAAVPLDDSSAVNPPPGHATDPSSSTHKGGIASFLADLLGDTHDERVENAQMLASGIEDIGKAMDKYGKTTLLRRMMAAQMKPTLVIEGHTPGGSGVGAFPHIDPTAAGAIMSRLGFR